ncbi:hypothetical protein CsSME_00049514 [Camellia sinensis var. sinensis]
MACVLLTGFCHHRMTSISTTNSPTAGSYSDHRFFRYGYNRRCWSEDEKGMKNNFTRIQIGAHKKRRLSFSPQTCSALVTARNSSLTNFYQEVIEAAREKFTREISFQSKDKDISLAKVILFLVCYFCFKLMMVTQRMIGLTQLTFYLSYEGRTIICSCFLVALVLLAFRRIILETLLLELLLFCL